MGHWFTMKYKIVIRAWFSSGRDAKPEDLGWNAGHYVCVSTISL